MTKTTQPKYRIRKRDEYNWVIERWQEGGEPIVKGRYAGGTTKAKWDEANPIGYFPSLREAAGRFLDRILADTLPEDGWTGENLQEAIAAAVAEVKAYVDEVGTDTATAEKGALIPPPSFDVPFAKIPDIRNAADPVATCLRITGKTKFKRTYDEKAAGLSAKDALLARLDWLEANA